MPLLKKKQFERAPVPHSLRDSDEVFYCAVTNEIFRDYEEFSERMFLCNSMVWTCSLTGKSNLTYAEALESEEAARKSLGEFPSELKTPILYIASKTKRTAFSDMADDVFAYAKDRFFIGENVETSFTGTKWKDSHVLQVIAPPNKSPPKKGNLDATLYKYEIEHLDAYDEDISEIMIADCNQIRRKKGSFSRERCKLFLKQYVEQDEKGVFAVKASFMESFSINKINFKQIFDGPPPQFDVSKKLERNPNGKKVRQESLHKFLTKSNNGVKNGTNSVLLEKMKKREEQFKLLKQQKIEKKLEMKQKKKEEKILLAVRLKDWYKPKEDLELIDHKKLPVPTFVKGNIPDEYFGDTLMVLEFVNSFSKILSTKDFFPNGLTIGLMERALTKNEVAGPFVDLLQMLLTALFNVQDQEASQYRTEIENPSSLKPDDASNNLNLHEATRLATIASTWSKKHQGVSLERLPLYSVTTSEILRLHLLGSGAVINNTGARWRYAQRGGYTSEDDPGLYLRVHSPHILKALEVKNVVELEMGDKMKVLSCLIDQLLTYADVRDVVEERMERVRQAKYDYKLTTAAEKRREQEFLSAKFKLKKAENPAAPQVINELQKLEMEADRKKAEAEYQLEGLKKASQEKVVLLGQDRALRQYLKLESVPGLFVNSEEENPGRCLSEIVKQNPTLVDAGPDATLAHLRELLKDNTNAGSSDKENSPSKSPKKMNGTNAFKNCENCDELLLCSADETSCVVHSKREKTRWAFYHETEKLDELVEALNKRGYRESELQQNLRNNKEEIEKLIEETPATYLNIDLPEQNEDTKRLRRSNKPKYEDANLGYPLDMSPETVLHNLLLDNILELEEKIYAGNLGALSIKDREKWRNCLSNKNYKDLDKTITQKFEEQDEQDAGHFFISLHKPEIPQQNDQQTQEAIHALAIALHQTANAVEQKYLKKPLGRVSSNKNDKKKEENLLGMWGRSLLASTSFSQIFLHYSTLDSCVMWGKSVLLARCRICRRQTDSENMLLCDSCNCGHHLYCLKPKLKSVPLGDWFCAKCQKEKLQAVEEVAEVATPLKKRPIFRDEEIDEEVSDDNEVESNPTSGDTEDDESDEECNEDEEENEACVKIDLCKTCGSGGELIVCEKCSVCYHVECVEPPLRRAPRGPWVCVSCKKNDEKKRYYDSSGDEIVNKRTTRREEGRDDLPLHNAALHQVLSEIMKDYNCWPFLRPVQKNEVPDYYDVITKPMDFGTIKYKLNMGEYHEDAQFMSDALLVFQNCNTYNHTEDDVYKCGVQLLKHFQKKCRELGLKLPKEMDYNDDTVRPKKKIRTK